MRGRDETIVMRDHTLSLLETSKHCSSEQTVSFRMERVRRCRGSLVIFQWRAWYVRIALPSVPIATNILGYKYTA